MSGHKIKDLNQRHYQKYSPDTLRNAVRDVLNNVYSTIDSAKKHKIPLQTLRDHIKYVNDLVCFGYIL